MPGKRKGLGRGLDALLGTESDIEPQSTGYSVQSVPLDKLEPNRFQPRGSFSDLDLEELAQSIRSQGIVQPIIVTPKDTESYRIVAGERRWRAARKVGLTKVPVIVREIEDDQQMLELALVENVQRSDLNAIEEAEAYKALSERFNLSQEEIAKKVGKGRTTITNTLRLLRLPQEIQDYLREGRLTPGQARPLLSLTEKKKQVKIADKAVKIGMSARELEALVGTIAKSDNERLPREKKKESKDVHTQAAVEQLTKNLQTKVDIVRLKQGGKILIYFTSEEELIRLHETLVKDIKYV